MSEIPSRIPVRFSDLINVSMQTVFVPEIHLIFTFRQPLDRERMQRALRLLLDAEPVLGCRFVSHWRSPWWERLPEETLDQARLLAVAEGDPDQALEDFLASRIPVEEGPQITCLLLGGAREERLAVKIQHATCDAGGFKALMEKLAEIYRALEVNPGYRPEPATGTRSMRQVYRRFSLLTLLAIFLRGLREVWRGIRPFRSLQVPSAKTSTSPLRFRFQRFSPEEAGRIMRAGGRCGATANDLFVTAVIRALKKTAGREKNHALRLAGTVDLRRYLPGRRADSLCQVSGLYTVCPGADPGPDFASTLALIQAEIREQKERFFGLGLMLFLYVHFGLWPWFLYKRFVPAFWKLGYRDGNIGPGFTNLGPIPAADFGTSRLTTAEMTTPGCVPPFFFAGVSGFNGSFCVSSGFRPDAVSPEWVEGFLAAIHSELMQFAEENAKD
ncbi:MAG: hypothetical protein AB1921_09665 [Thermodesulfobacteriota bacterium]